MTRTMLELNLKTVREEIHPGGDRADVLVTYTDVTGQTAMDSVRLNREDGRWKVCG